MKIKNLKQKIRKTLTGLVIATALILPSCKTLDKLQYPITPQGYAQIFTNEANQEVKRRNKRLDDFEAFLLIDKYQRLPEQPLIEEREKIEDLLESISGSAIDETSNYGQIGELKQEIGKLTKAKITIGNSRRKRIYSPILREQDRLENLEDSQSSVLELFEDFPYETNLGARIGLRDLKPSLTAYANIQDFPVLGFDFRKAEISANTNQEIGFQLQKPLAYNWYAELDLRTNLDTELDVSTLSITREFSQPHSKLSITTGIDETLAPSPFIQAQYILSW